MFNRHLLVNQLKETTRWDVVVIGGGASGLGVALDSASRGFKTLLLEQSDFAKGTSSRSTKLVHGGVRYLAQGNIDLVKEALYERGLMQQNASHLVQNQTFVIPNYRWWDRIFYTLGLKIYDLLAGKLSFGPSHHINRNEIQKRLPTLSVSALKGGVKYHDGQFDDARLAINLAQTCIEHGGTALNYFKVTGLIKDEKGMIAGLRCRDQETLEEHEVKAKVVINATGIFVDDILQLDDQNSQKLVRPSQGVHLVVNKTFLDSKDAIMIPKTSDGRVLFLVPWHDKVIIGTTDTVLEERSLEPKALDEEVKFILNNANQYLNKKIDRKDVRSIYAGLRPLAAPSKNSEKTKEISRSHKIIVTTSGLITLTGGKWTTYRKMAQDVINKAIQIKRLPKKKCVTKQLPIHGSAENALKLNHLYIYGADQKCIEALISEKQSLKTLLHPNLPHSEAEVILAVRNEMARNLEDVLARRVRMLFLDAKAAMECAPRVAALMAEELKQDSAWQKTQVAEFNALASQYML